MFDCIQPTMDTQSKHLDHGYLINSRADFKGKTQIILSRPGDPVRSSKPKPRSPSLTCPSRTASRLPPLGGGSNFVIHFAGLKAVGESVQKPLMYYDNNVVDYVFIVSYCLWLAKGGVFNCPRGGGGGGRRGRGGGMKGGSNGGAHRFLNFYLKKISSQYDVHNEGDLLWWQLLKWWLMLETVIGEEVGYHIGQSRVMSARCCQCVVMTTDSNKANGIAKAGAKTLMVVSCAKRDDRFARYGHAEFATPDATQEVSFISVFCTQTEWGIITGSSSEWVGLAAEMVVDVVAGLVVGVVADAVDLAGQAWQHSVQCGSA
ncbi:hypothetical protein L1987_49582 [Smallanthus sonchifolius]|uniref:Uncharacterized protein n=1 Tax=Smallanthus sonchifolius TaxID=185202 RepID=A0ACB9FUH2_9ASTR|nr:hypothetical protein L1987_49582 [Smallanthus sonchifolius]